MPRHRRLLRSSQQHDSVYHSPTHSHAVDGKKPKAALKKSKRAQMKARPECLNWDHTGTATPCDVQFFTTRTAEWKQACSTYHGGELGSPISWRSISGGDQLTVTYEVTISFYKTGFVMVQGNSFEAWGKTTFPLLQSRLDSPATTECDTDSTTGTATAESDSDSDPDSTIRASRLMSTPLRGTSAGLPTPQDLDATRETLIDSTSTDLFTDSDTERENSSYAPQDDSMLDLPNVTVTPHEPVTTPPGFPSEACQTVEYRHARNIDSLLAETSTMSITEGPDIEVLQSKVTQREQELEHEREKIQQLRNNSKLMKRDLSCKDDEIKLLQRQSAAYEFEVFTLKKEVQKQQKLRESTDNSTFNRRKQLERLDDQNTTLREANRKLSAEIDNTKEELLVMTAKYESVKPDHTQDRSPHRLSPLATPFHPQTAQGAGARPKTWPALPKINVANKGKTQYVPRESPAPQRPARKQPKPQRPANVTVIGASNTKRLSKHLQTDKISTVVYVNSGCRFQDLEGRAKQMVTNKTDVAVLHLGTNDALGQTSDSQCMLRANIALSRIEEAHQRAHPNVPLIVCSVPPTYSRTGQDRVNDINNILWSRCQKSKNLHFLHTGLSFHDIDHRDGVHLTDNGKVKLAEAIISGVQDFVLSPTRSQK